jgi:hypothetical protein
MKYPNLFKVEDLLDTQAGYTSTNINGKWLPARPEGYQSLWSRMYCAWLIFTGKADAVIWPGNQ